MRKMESEWHLEISQGRSPTSGSVSVKCEEAYRRRPGARQGGGGVQQALGKMLYSFLKEVLGNSKRESRKREIWTRKHK